MRKRIINLLLLFLLHLFTLFYNFEPLVYLSFLSLYSRLKGNLLSFLKNVD